MVIKQPRRLVFAVKGSPQWKYLALDYFNDSLVLVWPCAITTVVGVCSLLLDVPEQHLVAPMFMPVASLNNIKVWHYSWKSYVGVVAEYPKAEHKINPGFLLFANVCWVHYCHASCLFCVILIVLCPPCYCCCFC